MEKNVKKGNSTTALIWMILSVLFFLGSEGDSLFVVGIAVVNLIASWIYARRNTKAFG